MQSSLTDTAEWRAFCALAAEDPALLSDEAEILTRTLGCTFSESKVRYRLVADRLEQLFGDLGVFHVIEVGGGWGGQAAEIARRHPWVSYEFLDLTEAERLQAATLLRTLLDDPHSSTLAETVSRPVLALSSYALSECVADQQIKYLATLNKRACGYITWNGWLQADGLTLEEFRACLPVNHVLLDEVPRTRAENVVLAWGAR